MKALAGLTTREVSDRRARGLGNVMPSGTGRTFVAILGTNLFTLFNAVAGGCFLLLLALGAWRDALFGFFVVANTLIGVVQEFRAKRTLARLAVLNAPWARVRRDGGDVDCETTDVVLDDLLVLRPGDQVAADAEVVDGDRLEVDESLLTGEADPVSVVVGRELLSGSTIAAGTGLARVIRVGADSYAARITAEARQFSLVDSELRSSIGRVIRWISLGLLPIAALVVNGQMQAAGGWAIAMASGAWRDAAIAAVASLIAVVPQGLVFMTSVALAVGAVKLARRHVLVRELAAVEGLARVDMLCVDKTGTLTEGSLVLDRAEPVPHATEAWRNALAWFAADPAANATAQAIGASFTIDANERPAAIATVPFSSHHKWSAASFDSGTLPGTWVLGGPDVVLRLSDSSAVDVLARAADMAASGRRTLVLAHTRASLSANDVHGAPQLPPGLEPVVLLVFRERVRSDAADTLRYFADQGVEICVISGDDPRTVAAVARDAGLAGVVRGIDARTLPGEPSALAEAIRTERVFGRVTPEQKKAMVTAFQSLGHTVAMTGDGINDTLALKHADLGIAMGTGSPAARAVAHVVLLDGAFARLPGIVAEGRQVIANVERMAKLFLSKTVYATLLAVIFGVGLWPFPFLPRQLSVADGLTIGLPALALALMPNPRIYRPGFLVRAARFCVPSGVIVALAITAVVACAHTEERVSAAELHTAAFVTLTLSALSVLTVLLRPLSYARTAIVLGGYAGLAAVLTVPLMTDFLGLVMPPVHILIAALVASGVASLLLEVVHRRLPR